MYPILYSPTETNFTKQGLGVLSDAISATVEEKRNGSYELEIKYPFDGIHFGEIQHSSIIKVKPYDNAGMQLFRVYKITSPLNKVCTINAEHISYQLNYVPLMPFTAYNAGQAFTYIAQNMAEANPFTFWTDVNCAATYTQDAPEMVRARLGGQEGSILDVYGGEYEWDNYVVRLHQNRGIDRDVILQYGKNITDISQEENISSTYTGITPFWRGEEIDADAKSRLETEIQNLQTSIQNADGSISSMTQTVQQDRAAWDQAKAKYGADSVKAKNKKEQYQGDKKILDHLTLQKSEMEAELNNKQSELQTVEGTMIQKLVTLNPPTLYAEDADSFPFQRVRTLDCSSIFETRPTTAQLEAYARNWMNANLIGEPKISIKVSFVALWDTEEYKSIAPLERVQLCDTVAVEFERLGIRVAAKVTSYKYDVLMERYESIQLGEAKSDFAKSVSTTNGLLIETLKQVPSRSAMQNAIDLGTEIMKGGFGGYIKYHTDADGHPTEMLIMDEPEEEDAHQIILFNKNGIGYSSNGGATFSSAWVFLGNGTQALPYRQMFYADIIRAGILGDQAGANYWNMETGEFKLTGAAKVGTDTLSNYVDDKAASKVTTYDSSLNQAAVFNKLTQNGTKQGIALGADGNLYINATYISSGTLSGDRIQGGTVDSANIVSQSGSATSGSSRREYRFKLSPRGLAVQYKDSTYWDEYAYIGLPDPITYLQVGQKLLNIHNSSGPITIYSEDSLWLEAKQGTDVGVYSECIRGTTLTSSDAKSVYIGPGYRLGLSSSSRRYKHDIKPIETEGGKLDPHKILDIEVVQFKFNADLDDPESERYLKDVPGLIAEDVDEHYPIAADHSKDKNGNVQVDNWNERYIIPPMLALIQEQHHRIENLESELETLKTQMANILEKIGE